MKTRLASRFFLVAVLLFTLAGCGQKGPLYLPDTDDNEEQQESALPEGLNIA